MEIDKTGTAGIVEEWMEPCEHEFVKTTAEKSKKVTYFCLHCGEQRTEAVIPLHGNLMKRYQEIIDEQIQFSELKHG